MKKLAIFIGGLLVLPAFAEVAPVFYEDIEYTDVVYDEYGNPVYYTDYTDADLTPETDENVTTPSVPASRSGSASRANTNRTTIGRTVPTGSAGAATGRASAANSSRAVAARGTSNTSPRSSTNARSVTSRGTTSRTTSTAATRTTTNVAATNAAAARATGGAGHTSATRTGSTGSGTVARTTTTKSTRNATSSRTATTGARVNRASTNAAVGMVTTAGAASPIRVTSVTGTTGTSPLTVSDNTLYNPNRASIRGSTTVANRVPTIRMASVSGLSTDTTSVSATTPAEMDELAELTDYCKAQYAACMDNYCNVLDDNQGRCSCSANIKNYAQAEAALKQATEELQEVAQKIQYIGLSAREVETLFTQTEAELKMQSTTDTSQLKTSLDKIKDMIIEVQSGTASSSNSSFLSFDLSGLLDFTIDSTGFDLSSFLGGFGTNSSGINNQRGEELFKTATNRCKANVLKSCTAQGVDAALITNAYDLEIDKECIAYERSLNDSNDQMVATVRNAKSVLQKARLLVEQSKNEYDMRGCINALDSCMQDEYVCGSDYEKCLDPSGRYIVNGEIVIGTDPGRAVNGINDGSAGVLNGDICSMNLYNVWNYGSSTPGQTNSSQSGCKNAWNSYSLNGSGNGDLADYIKETLYTNVNNFTTTSLSMSQYIQQKIGYHKDDKNYGMCMSVLNKCQDYTYTGTGNSRKYKPDNEVVKQYLERMLIQIKARQDEILAEHAESCITDVTTCLSQNNYPFEETADNPVQANIAINACRSTVVTCMSVNGYSVADPTPSDLSSWICGITTGDVNCIPNSGGGNTQEITTYTVTYDCNKHNVTNNITWTGSVSGTSASLSMVFDSKNKALSECSYPGFEPYGGYSCTYTSGTNTGNGFLVGFGNTFKIRGNATCKVYRWDPTSNNTTCSAGNLSYCTTENECTASAVGGKWCYASTSATQPSCVSTCSCNANDLGSCTTVGACIGVNSNNSFCTSDGSSGVCSSLSSSSGRACCYGSIDNCNTEEKCKLVGNCWNSTTNTCTLKTDLSQSCPTNSGGNTPAFSPNYSGTTTLDAESVETTAGNS
ncbi:MAG: hypothetical protein IJQ90_00665 [Alphaproteobacteria bacterium]|nr:hypothetical protein [Alphaproteobacteria bacterium]